jgi:hypothetical protein
MMMCSNTTRCGLASAVLLTACLAIRAAADCGDSPSFTIENAPGTECAVSNTFSLDNIQAVPSTIDLDTPAGSMVGQAVAIPPDGAPADHDEDTGADVADSAPLPGDAGGGG